jgi:hypothetical protein
VTPQEALALAEGAGRTGQFDVEVHVFTKHRLTRRTVQLALMSATEALYQADNDRWRLEGGKDEDGNTIHVVVRLEGRVFVVTAFEVDP